MPPIPTGHRDEAKELAEAWGAELVDAGDSGHLNSESGHGPWPDGLLRFAGFLMGLSEPGSLTFALVLGRCHAIGIATAMHDVATGQITFTVHG